MAPVAVYDRGRRAGVLKPDSLGAPIVFTATDLPESGPEPKLFQRYSYSVVMPGDGGQPRAASLHPCHTTKPQGECEMDLNELLHAHQVEVMKAGASSDQGHFAKIAEYADRIRQLRTVLPGTPVAPDLAAPPTIIYGSYAGRSSADPDGSFLAQGCEESTRGASENPDRGHADL